MRFMTLHVRLTRDCNAHCDYCSSAGARQGRMTPDDFRASIDFIADRVLPRIGAAQGDFLTIEYLGGEILLVPTEELRGAVDYARERFGRQFRHVRDGAQSNLQASPRRVAELNAIFDGRVGTSTDAGTGQRRLRGSSELYGAILERSSRALAETNGRAPGRAMVVDAESSPHLGAEIRRARARGYDLVLQPVFSGGTEGIAPLSAEALADALVAAYDVWAESPGHRVDPFSSLFARRLLRGRIDPTGDDAARSLRGCPFQNDCAATNLALDPDGSLWVCQQMADAGQYPLGNAIEGRFDERTWRLLARRSLHLDTACSRCPWFAECGGGCMKEAIALHGDPFARTEYCLAWKRLFRRIEADIAAGRIPPALQPISEPAEA